MKTESQIPAEHTNKIERFVYMHYIVFDLEWNQPDDGKKSSERELLFEIIEIGAIKLNDKFEIVSKFQEIVKPTVYKKINWHTKKMLHLEENELQRGKVFPVVCKRFLEWCGEDYIFCTWGSQDITELQRNMEYYQFPPLAEGPIRYYNLQKIFAIRLDDPNVTRNLEAAVDMLQITKKIPFHRAYSDAYYSGKIMQRMGPENILNLYSYDLYHIPSSAKQEIRYFTEDEFYYVSKGYEQKQDLLANRKIMQLTCAKCNDRALRPKIRWFNTNAKTMLAAAVCDKHGALRGRIRIRRNQNELYYAEKILNYVPMEELEELRKKKKTLKAHAQSKEAAANQTAENQAQEKQSERMQSLGNRKINAQSKESAGKEEKSKKRRKPVRKNTNRN